MTRSFRLPAVTLLLVVACILGSVLVTFNPDLLQSDGFLAHQPTIAGTLIGPFLHVNLVHLLGNLIFLAAVGGSLELATGSWRFLLVYVLSALAGEAVQFLAFHNDPMAPALVGASAAVAGCASYFALRYYRLRIPVAPKVSLSILSVVAIWAFLQLLGAFVHLGNSHTQTSFWSHLGGLSMGAILCALIRSPDLRQSQLDEAVLDEVRRQGPQVMLEASKAVLASKPKDLNALRQLQEAACTVGDKDEEANALARLIELNPKEPPQKELERLLEIHKLEVLPAEKRYKLALEVKDSNTSLALEMLESVGFRKGSPMQAESLFEVGNLCAKTDVNRLKKAMDRLNADCPTHPLHVQARARGWISS